MRNSILFGGQVCEASRVNKAKKIIDPFGKFIVKKNKSTASSASKKRVGIKPLL